MRGIFLTGGIRSGTSWLFSLLEEKINPSYFEQFDYLDLTIRRNLLQDIDQFLFKINEDMRQLNSLHAFFPNAKIIVLIRHPLEALHSIHRPNLKSIPFRPFKDLKTKWRYPEDKDLFPAALRRLESYFPSDAMSFLKQSNDWLKVFRYEDLLGNFKFHYGELLKFAEIDRACTTLDILPQKTPNQGVRLKEFSESEKDMIMGSDIPLICKQLGYMDL